MSNARTPSPPYPAQDLELPGKEAAMDPAPRWRAPDYLSAGKLRGKRCLVTGGDSGIGRAVAWLFAREGADVAITHLQEESADADEVVAAIRELGRKAHAFELDVRDPAAATEVIREAVGALDGIDVLVNNAAFQHHVEAIADLELEQWNRTIATNITGYFVVAKAALEFLGDGGAIINTGSTTGLDGSAGLLDYSATKGAIHAFTKSLAQQLVERRIRVNCVAPGPVWTPLNPAERPYRGEHGYRDFGKSTPYGRPAQPEEIAPLFVFLASNADSSYMTGEVIALLGGETTAG